MTTTVTRRDLFKFGGLPRSAWPAPARSPAAASQDRRRGRRREGPGRHGRRCRPRVPRAQEPITDFAETHEYDVVVVGAGESGLSAVHTALEAGARVACVQNINAAQTTR